MSRSAGRLVTSVAGGWMLVAGIFLFVKGLDISLVACDGARCGGVGELAPGVISFTVGVGMLLAWPALAAGHQEEGWYGRLGLGLVCGTLAVALSMAPALALTDRLGVPLWIGVALITALALPLPTNDRGYAIRGRATVAILLACAVVGAEWLLDGDAYVLAFTMCAALTPPAFSGVDDRAVAWRHQAAESLDGSRQSEDEPLIVLEP